MAICLFLTLYIFFACYVTARFISSLSGVVAFLAAVTMACAQIVLSELAFGLMGLLYKEILLVSNLFFSTLVICFAFNRCRNENIRQFSCRAVHADNSLSKLFDGYNKILLILVVFSYAIVITASYLLPPRGIDDLAYHIPIISEYTRSHTIKLLSLQIREAFAYPQNAELLFLWPLIFSGSQKMIDSVNVPFVFLSIFAVYALIRNFMVSDRDALFYSMIYALCPVVLMQAGSNYIDILLTLFLILSLFFTILFLRQGRNCHAWYAALSIGMACGMKYTALFLTLPLQILICHRLISVRRKQAAGFLVTVCLLGGYWYFRNAIELGNPFYPMNPLVSGLGFMHGSGQSNGIMDVLVNIYDWFWLFLLGDIGVGTLDGGFGLVFWGLGFPSWLCILLYTLLKYEKENLTKLIALLPLPIGILILLLVPKHSWIFNGRYALFIVPIGLLALSLAYDMVRDNVYRHTLKIVCIVFSFASVCLLSVSDKPSFRFDTVLSSPYRGTMPSEYLYPMSNPIDEDLRHVWYLLDYLTRDDRSGVDCYIASNKPYLAIALFYGSNLQNNVISIGADVPPRPGAFVYLYFPREVKSEFIDEREFYYPNTKIKLEDVLSNPDYVLVAKTERGCLIMHRAYLNKPGKTDILQTYYAASWSGAVRDAGRLIPHLTPGVPLVTADEIAYGLFQGEADRVDKTRVIMVPEGYELHVARAQNLSVLYTLGKPLAGYEHTKVSTVLLNDRQIDVFLNQET